MPERIFVAPAHVVIQSVQKRVGDGVTKAAFDLGLVARQWPEVEGEEFIRDAVDPVLAAALVLGDGADARSCSSKRERNSSSGLISIARRKPDGRTALYAMAAADISHRAERYQPSRKNK